MKRERKKEDREGANEEKGKGEKEERGGKEEGGEVIIFSQATRKDVSPAKQYNLILQSEKCSKKEISWSWINDSLKI